MCSKSIETSAVFTKTEMNNEIILFFNTGLQRNWGKHKNTRF